VRKILDALAAANQKGDATKSAPSGRQRDVLGEPTLPDGFDAARNPDLKLLFARSGLRSVPDPQARGHGSP
jgi:hypothetical protein